MATSLCMRPKRCYQRGVNVLLVANKKHLRCGYKAQQVAALIDVIKYGINLKRRWKYLIYINNSLNGFQFTRDSRQCFENPEWWPEFYRRRILCRMSQRRFKITDCLRWMLGAVCCAECTFNSKSRIFINLSRLFWIRWWMTCSRRCGVITRMSIESCVPANSAPLLEKCCAN